MPITSRELVNSRGNNDDAGGKVGTVRDFQVETSPDLALRGDAAGIVPPIPKIGDALPWDSTQTVYNRTADWEQGSLSVTRVRVFYSSDPPVWGGNTPDPFFKSWNLSYYRVAQPIPYAVRDKRSLRYTDATGTTQPIVTFPVAHVTHWESRSKFMRRCRVTKISAAQWEPIQDFANKLCKIYNKWYLFTVSDLQEIARNVWDVTYAFEFDPGTPNVFPNTPAGDVYFPGNLTVTAFPGQPGTFARPPYHEVRVIPGYNVGTGLPDWPLYVGICPYQFVETGHLTLPGFGPL